MPHDDVLLNLSEEAPAFFSRFNRLIEVVGKDEGDKTSARTRFRFYKDRGYDLKHHDLESN